MLSASKSSKKRIKASNWIDLALKGFVSWDFLRLRVSRKVLIEIAYMQTIKRNLIWENVKETNWRFSNALQTVQQKTRRIFHLLWHHRRLRPPSLRNRTKLTCQTYKKAMTLTMSTRSSRRTTRIAPKVAIQTTHRQTHKTKERKRLERFSRALKCSSWNRRSIWNGEFNEENSECFRTRRELKKD